MLRAALAGLVLASFTLSASAETIRIAIGTQDTTINCAAGGLLIRELGLLDKYLPSAVRTPRQSVNVPPASSIIGSSGAQSHKFITGSSITSARPVATKT